MIEGWQTPHMELAADTKQIARYSPTSTPVLDVLRPLPTRKRIRLNAGEYLFLSGAVILTLMGLPAFRRCAEYLSPWLGVGPASLVVCLVIPGSALLAALAAHEAGHLFAARMAGFRLSFFRRGYHAELYSCDALRLGILSLEPRKLDHLPQRLCFFAFGGPFVSLSLPLLVETYAQMAPVSFLAAFAVHVFTAVSMLLGVAELLPDTGKGSFSDGSRILMLLKNDALARRWLSIVRLQLALDRGDHPRAWDETLVACAAAVNDDSRDAVAGRWLAYLWASERQDITAATKYLEEALAAPAPATAWLRDRLFLEAAVFQAWFREDSASARYWVERIRSRRLSPVQQLRLKVALLWAEGKLFDGFERLGDYLKLLGGLPASPARDLAEKSALEWKEQMKSRMLSRAWRAMYSLTQQVELSAAQRSAPSAESPEIASW
jgi:hypothetical protein